MLGRLAVFTVMVTTLVLQAGGAALPVTATPPKVQEPDGDWVIADVAKESGFVDWWPQLSATFQAQGFNVNQWKFTGVMLLGNATFNVTKYTLGVEAELVTETIDFTLVGGPVPPPNHWLQLINESQPFPSSENGGKAFGYQIPGLPGYWQMDNGDQAPGTGPFYDSNANPGQFFSVPPDFHDGASQDSPCPSYMHFWTIPVWDVVDANNNHSMTVADEGVTWGWVDVPLPSCLAMAGPLLIFISIRRRRGPVNG